VIELARNIRQLARVEPYRFLAGCGLPVYITTDPFEILADALREAGAKPVVELCPWNAEPGELPSVWDREPEFVPTPERPLVLHLFGMWRSPETIVISDDHLVDWASREGRVPLPVRGVIARSTLLFLGFGLEDQDFRVVHRTFRNWIKAPPRQRVHVAAQVELTEDVVGFRDIARDYLEKHFDRADVAVFWGTVDEFVRKLNEQMEEVP
jgi:hypothetical protein